MLIFTAIISIIVVSAIIFTKLKRRHKPNKVLDDLISAINENHGYFDAKDDAIWMNIEEVDRLIQEITKKYKEEMKYFEEKFPIDYDFPEQAKILNQLDGLLSKMKSELGKFSPPKLYELYHKNFVNMLEELEEYSKNHRAYLYFFNKGANNDTPENRNRLIIHQEKSIDNLQKYAEKRKNLKDLFLLEMEASLKAMVQREAKYLKDKNIEKWSKSNGLPS